MNSAQRARRTTQLEATYNKPAFSLKQKRGVPPTAIEDTTFVRRIIMSISLAGTLIGVQIVLRWILQ